MHTVVFPFVPVTATIVLGLLIFPIKSGQTFIANFPGKKVAFLLNNFNIVYPDRIYKHFSVVPDSFLVIDFCSRWRKNFTAPSRRKASATSRPADRMAESSALRAPKKEKQAVSACFLFQICSSVLRGEPLSRNISSEALRSLFHAVLHPCTSRERCRGSRQGSASWQA